MTQSPFTVDPLHTRIPAQDVDWSSTTYELPPLLVAVDTTHAGEIPPREVAQQFLAESGAETRALPGGGTTH